MNKNLEQIAILSSLLENRIICLSITGITSVHLTLVAFGLPSWQCPIRHNLGIPCPGCGLSRGIYQLLQGHWQNGITIHAFSPLVLLGILIIIIAGLLPNKSRIWLTDKVQFIEQKTGITFIFISSLFLYWLVRLLFFPKILYSLVM